MNIATNTSTVYTVELTDADVGEILADPAAFLQELRARRNALAKERAIRTGRVKRDIVIAPKAEAAGRGRTSIPQPCPKCGRLFLRLKKHAATCTGEPASA